MKKAAVFPKGSSRNTKNFLNVTYNEFGQRLLRLAGDLPEQNLVLIWRFMTFLLILT